MGTMVVLPATSRGLKKAVVVRPQPIHPMKNRFFCTLSIFLLCAAAILSHQACADDAIKTARTKIYDESLDGSKQIADALKVAKKENKRVLLQFGANWCGWCHLLHNLFKSNEDISKRLKADYVVVLIDVNEKHNEEIDKKYRFPTRLGLPAIVILDSDGKELTTKDTEKLEEGNKHDPEKVLDFLKEWSPKK